VRLVLGSIQSREENKGRKRQRWQRYHTLWTYLFLAWMFCYIDRSVTGPVVSWMIKNKVSFLADTTMPYAIGGIIGSMFFAGYMLTQFPAGYLGDKYGRKVMLVISTAWSGIFTGITALSNSLTAFVATRVATGLGEGAYYSNDRAMVASETPVGKRSMGMGIVFIGLGAGLTIATVFTPYILDASSGPLGKEVAWTVPCWSPTSYIDTKGRKNRQKAPTAGRQWDWGRPLPSFSFPS
jgi:MFS family permease